MCGIVAVLRRPSTREVPDPDDVLRALSQAEAVVARAIPSSAGAEVDPARLQEAARLLEAIDTSLRGAPGVACLLRRSSPSRRVVDELGERAEALLALLDGLEVGLDTGQFLLRPEHLERINALVVRLKDGAWALARDRVGATRAIAELIGSSAELIGVSDKVTGVSDELIGGSGGSADDTPLHELDAWWSIQVALASIDRLEVRGRDSAGIHVLVDGHGIDLASPQIRAEMASRQADPLFPSLAVRVPGGRLSLVYKAAAEIGELGDNTKALRRAISADHLLARALAHPDARVTVLGHTRWASVGIISQANAHPINSEEVGRASGPYVTAALNGDVDNYADLRLSEMLALPDELTTDAKVIPTLVSHRMAEGRSAIEAFAETVARFHGSVAIAASVADTPDQILLALRGSGQGLYVGLAEDVFVVASEPYGLVEETRQYVRLEGESTQGQIAVLNRDGAGTLEGLQRSRYDATPLPVRVEEVQTAGITTRDIDRREHPHFLLKEISEAPKSFRKTLRGKIVEVDGLLSVLLGDDTLPPPMRRVLASGAIRRILVIGQGTAAVAGQGVAAALARCVSGVAVLALPATELSGFGLSDDMADTLVVAISQSGTTTDTNRTVDLARSRGAQVIGVVNRRNSDLAEKAHGVLYTSDGRDVEMSVASTKAFYAQIAAGWLLAMALAAAMGRADPRRDHRLLTALRDIPELLEQVLALRPEIARIAAEQAPSRRYWAIVGSGPERVAAEEIRIKLSELCYKAIACDATEDKKHIDLSSEPLILVCAAGLSAANVDDVAKEVAIYRAHRAAPVVIASAHDAATFSAAVEVIGVPACEPDLALLLSAMVGHLFGYEAALAIDAGARPLREARAVIEAYAGSDQNLLEQLGEGLESTMGPFLAGMRRGEYDGHLDARTAVGLVSLLRYASGRAPLDGYEYEFGKVGAPSAVIGDLLEALNAGVDGLTRPVDAIKHQAKTVTVGISRNEDALLTVPLVKEVLSVGLSPERLGYRALRTLAGLSPAVEQVLGYTRYLIETDAKGNASIAVREQAGVAVGLASRTAGDPRLRGTKHRAYDEREVTVARGRSDGRTVILVPEVADGEVAGMLLLHARFVERLATPEARAVMVGYRDRYSALSDAVTETEPRFADDRLGLEPLVDLLTEPVYVLAERWRRGVS